MVSAERRADGPSGTGRRAMSPFQRAFQKPFEEQPLGKRERNDARGHDDDIDSGEIRPRPLPLSTLGGGEHDGHGAFRLVVDERDTQQIFAPGRDKIDNEDHHQTIAHHRQAHFPQRPPMSGAVDPRSLEYFMGTSWNMLRMIKTLIASCSVT